MYAVNFGLELPDCDVDFPAESISCRDKAKGKGTYPNFMQLKRKHKRVHGLSGILFILLLQFFIIVYT